MRALRQITNIGNSLGVTLPREILNAYGLGKGALVELRPVAEGLLIRPAKIVSAFSPQGRELVKSLVRRYRGAFDAIAKEDRRVAKR